MSCARALVFHAGLTLNTPPKVGTTLLVLDGPGVGQSRQIVSVGEGNATVVLDTPLDDWVVTAPSLGSAEQHSSDAIPSKVAVVSSFGSKIFAGNTFNWTEVVQWCVRRLLSIGYCRYRYAYCQHREANYVLLFAPARTG